jgi:hypothetical protein
MDDVPPTAEDYGPEDLREVKAGCLEVATRLRVLRMREGAVNPPALRSCRSLGDMNLSVRDSFAVRSRTQCEASLPDQWAWESVD